VPPSEVGNFHGRGVGARSKPRVHLAVPAVYGWKAALVLGFVFFSELRCSAKLVSCSNSTRLMCTRRPLSISSFS